MHTIGDLRQMQSLPLEAKIIMTERRIREWHEAYDGQVYVSFSGGKDSTVLLDIARNLYPDIEAVFVDTGLEYPEVRQFAKSFENVTVLRPNMSFKDVIIQYGYPFISKEVSQTIYEVRRSHKKGNKETKREKKFLATDEYSGKSRFNQSKYIPLLKTDFVISHMCCKVNKKSPLKPIEKRLKPITGIMAAEGMLRQQQWMKSGCNAFDAKKQVSNPMAFWTEQDILQYILQKNLKTASVYGELIEVDSKGNPMMPGCGGCLSFTKCQRTGCIFCGFGAHLDTRKGGTSRFVRLKRTHPKQYAYCMDGGEFVNGIWQPNDKGLGMWYPIEQLNRLYSKKLKSGKVKQFIEI